MQNKPHKDEDDKDQIPRDSNRYESSLILDASAAPNIGGNDHHGEVFINYDQQIEILRYNFVSIISDYAVR